MEGDLADKPHIPHIHWWDRVFPLVLFVALLLLPAGPISDAGFVRPSGVHSDPACAPILAQLSDSTIDHQQTQQIQQASDLEIASKQSRSESNPSIDSRDTVGTTVQSRKKREGKKADLRQRLHSIVEEIAARHNVDPALIKAIIMAESGYNPKAVSKKGAIGLMQLMPATAQELGVKELFDPKDNVEAGVRYFKRLLRRFGGDVRLALAAYNAGSTKVRRYRGIPPIGATRYYVKKVFHYYRLYKKESAGQTNDA